MHLALLNVLALAALADNLLTLGSGSHVFLPPLLLLVGDGALGALAGARVGLGALTADGQALAVPHAAVAADLGQALDVHRHVTAEVALHSVAVADDLAQLGLIFLGQILHAGVGVDSGLGQVYFDV